MNKRYALVTMTDNGLHVEFVNANGVCVASKNNSDTYDEDFVYEIEKWLTDGILPETS